MVIRKKMMFPKRFNESKYKPVEQDELSWQLDRRLNKKFDVTDRLLDSFEQAIQSGHRIDLSVAGKMHDKKEKLDEAVDTGLVRLSELQKSGRIVTMSAELVNDLLNSGKAQQPQVAKNVTARMEEPD